MNTLFNQINFKINLLMTFILISSCDGDSVISPDDFEIVGSWALTGLEQARGNYSSDWTLNSNNTYEWDLYVELLGIDEEGTGFYNLSGDTLFINGVVANVLDTEFLKLTLKQNSFSFLDDDGDRWTYSRK